MSALVDRLAQSLFSVDELDLQIYTDDPVATMVGTSQQVDRYITVLVLAWRALGLNLAFAKGQLGCETTWVGHDVTIDNHNKTVNVSIKKQFLE